jgi:hypothetical protein
MKPSLTRRLLLLYAATMVVILSLSGGLVWFMMKRALYAGLDEALRAEALALAGRLEADEGRIEFEQGLIETTAPAGAEALVQIVEERGGKVFSSPGIDGREALRDRMPAGAGSPFWFTAALPPDGRPYRVMALKAIVWPEEHSNPQGAIDGGITAWVFVARPLAHVDQTLAQLGTILGFAVAVSVLAALAGGWIVTRRGIRPVQALVESVGHRAGTGGRAGPGRTGADRPHHRAPAGARARRAVAPEATHRRRGA